MAIAAIMKREPTKNWIDRICIGCQKQFKCRPFIVNRGDGKYCSLECLNKANKQSNAKKRKEKLPDNDFSKRSLYRMKYESIYPDKVKAGKIAREAKRKGILMPIPCEKCGDDKVQMHHKDYGKPLEVNWLCAMCHRHEHI